MNAHVINGTTVKEFAQAAGTAAGNAAVPVVGGIVGSTLAGIVSDLFGGGKKGDQISADMRAFIQRTGAGAFEQWVRANRPEAIAWTTKEILPLFYVWLLESGKSVLWWSNDLNPRGYAYVQGLTEDVYASMGVDYWKSVANRQAGIQSVTNGRWDGWVMLPGGGTSQVPAPVVSKVRQALNNAADKLGQQATNALGGKLKELEAASDSTGNGGGTNGGNTGLLLLGGAVLAAVALR